MNLKHILSLVLALAPAVAAAQAFPAKPVRIIVPFGPGGVADITARVVAPKMSEVLGQPVVVENKPSAGGIVAGQEVARAEPDGHTLLLINNGTAVSKALFKSLPYEPSSFAMISTIGYFPLVILADPKSPFRGTQDLVAEAKRSPGRMNAATIGIGSTQNLAAELFKSSAGADFQIVPYKNPGEVVAAARSGDAHELDDGALSDILAFNVPFDRRTPWAEISTVGASPPSPSAAPRSARTGRRSC